MDLIQERGEREREREGLQRGGKGGMLEEGSGKGQGHALHCFQCVCVCVCFCIFALVPGCNFSS